MLKKQFLSASFLSILTITGITWLTDMIFHSQRIEAQTPEVNLSIIRQKEESYDTFLKRAEALASSTLQNQFKTNQSLAELTVVIVGENQGAIAPILSLSVTRERWESNPNTKRWATYFSSSKLLLGFDSPSVQAQPQTTLSPSPSPDNSRQPQLSPSETPNSPNLPALTPSPQPSNSETDKPDYDQDIPPQSKNNN